jgi:phosphoribosylanthranilate isomerase
MLIKVCGMRDRDNILRVATTGADWMGFIFYSRSSRAITGHESAIKECPLRRVGVFVDATVEEMMEKATMYKLDFLQLHGKESPDTCYALQKRGFGVIKAISVATVDDLAATADYEGRVDYFLFDTLCPTHGGSGRQFDWSLLTAYKGGMPFLLSGGINPSCVEAIHRFSHPLLAGIDINSGFETAPGIKDAEKIRTFIGTIKNTRI